MRVDKAVAARKFEREIKRLTDQKAALDERGIFLLGGPKYPIIELLFVPKHPLFAGFTPVSPPQVPGESVEIPTLMTPALAARAFKVRFNLSDYDLVPPSLEFRDPWSDDLLDYRTIFRAQEFEAIRGPHLVLLDDHPLTHKPFLCLRGVREYHDHPQHTGDDWMLYRSHMSVFSLAMSVWRVSIDLVRPLLVLHPGGSQIQWLINRKQ
jgi:hypothetical protein